MIRELKESDFKRVNELLNCFNYSIDSKIFSEQFTKVIIYFDEMIKGVLVFDYIYDRIEIEYIVVDPKHRKIGIATKLLKYIEENYKAKNITLEVKKNNIPAINFYNKSGFSIVSVRKNYYKDEDGYLMLKEIGDKYE